ncbi:PRC and DUF2382 domain-containing protein [Streptosporangium sp. KLBMP 9127]|nr:PRC and DUF2382 domain-containing protein [Streptosporangium sp. KLBMP 9127]
MITQQQIPTVIHQHVYDKSGQRVGEVRHVYVDDATGQPEWLGVKTGMFGTRETFVPVRDADVIADHVEVGYDKERIKHAPNVDVDAGGHLSVEEERDLYRYYDIDWAQSWQRANQPGEGGWAREGGQQEQQRLREDERFQGEGLEEERPQAERAGESDTMIRYEEQLHVTTESHETGRARLHKYIVTEEQQITVPLTREEVRIEREPITEANLDPAMRGQDLTESEHEVTLHEERPSVTKRTVPVERVRMTKERVTEERTISEQLRKEHIDVEGDTDEPGRPF